MIFPATFQLATSLATELSDLGYAVAASPNSALQDVTRHASPFVAKGVDEQFYTLDPMTVNKVDMDSLAYAVQATTSGDNNNPSIFEESSAGLVRDLSKMVTTHLSYAKNEVRPTFTDFKEKLVSYLENYQPKNPATNFEITQYNFPEVLTDGLFADEIRRYIGTTIVEAKPISLGERTNDELLQLLLTGSKSIDKRLAEWAGDLSSNLLRTVWYSLFGLGQESGTNSLAQNGVNLAVHERIDHSLVAYLFARNLYNNPAEDSKLSLNDYKTQVAGIRDYAGRMLAENFRVFSSYLSSKVLILSADKTTAVVNGPVYKEWLSTGGSVELLYGVLVSGDRSKTVNAINEKLDSYRNNWSTYVAASMMSETTRSFQNFKTYLLGQFSIELEHPTSMEFEYGKTNANYKETAKRLACEYVEKLTPEDMKQPNKIAMELVARCRYFYSSAYRILSDMEEVARLSPNINPREAALLASIRYLSTYFASQLSIVK